MDNLLADIKAYALSNDDIQEFLNPDTKILIYPELAHVRHIDQIFDSLGRCVLLFLTTGPTSGHWTVLFKRNGHIEWFDSYGEKPEQIRETMDEERLEELGQGEPYLWNLLKASGKRVYSSNVKYQSERADIATCGRWCLARLICKDYSNNDFHSIVRNGMKESGLTNYDDWVALFTYSHLGK
jgi:hypothetical protein